MLKMSEWVMVYILTILVFVFGLIILADNRE